MTMSFRKMSTFQILLGVHLSTMMVCSFCLLVSSSASMANFDSGSDKDHFKDFWRFYEEYGILLGLFPFVIFAVGGLYHYFVIRKQDQGTTLRHKWSCFVKLVILVLPWTIGVLTVALLIQVDKYPHDTGKPMEAHHDLKKNVAKRCMVESMIAQFNFVVVNLLSFIILGIYRVLEKYVLKPILKNTVVWSNQGDAEGFVELKEDFEDVGLTN